jgi:hypothetical protein
MLGGLYEFEVMFGHSACLTTNKWLNDSNGSSSRGVYYTIIIDRDNYSEGAYAQFTMNGNQYSNYQCAWYSPNEWNYVNLGYWYFSYTGIEYATMTSSSLKVRFNGFDILSLFGAYFDYRVCYW